jgi:gliding motility-associated-like protein
MCEKSLKKSAKFLSFSALLIFINIPLNAQVQANFTADTTNGCGSITVTFTNTSSGNIANYEWDFGNGNSSILQNPSATYSSAGTFDVELIVSNASGTERDTIIKTNFITVYNQPNAKFNFTPNGGCSPLTVNFTNSSTVGDAPIVSNRWVFADGSQPFFGNNATHTYQTPGNFQPSLEVVDQNGCMDFAVDDTVFVTPSPRAQFSTLNSRVFCNAPYTVNFNSNSTGFNLNYYWDFGDGNNSTQENPSHTYNTLGKYDVTLIVSDSSCNDTLSRSEYIILENSIANFNLSKDTLCAGEPFTPIDNSQGVAIYSWNFGDGTTINSSQPTHTYQDSGTYVIRLSVSAGAACTDSYLDTVYVQKVTAGFTTDSTFSCMQSDTITFEYTGFNASQFIWKIGIGDSSKEYSTNSTIISHIRMGGSGEFDDTLIAISSAGCSDTIIKPKNRTVEYLNAHFAFNGEIPSKDIEDTLYGCLPFEAHFRDTSSGPGVINKWKWKFSSNDSSNLQHPIYTFDIDTTYNIEFTVWNNLGCSASFNKKFLGGYKQNPSFTFFPDTLCPNDTLFITDQSSDTSLIQEYRYTLIPIGRTISTSPIFTDIPKNLFFDAYPDTGRFLIEGLVSHNGCDTAIISSTSVFVKGPMSEVTYSSNCINRNQINFFGDIKEASRFYWYFGDSTDIDSVNENPTHTYSTIKAYMGTLTTYNDTNGCGGPFIDTFYVNLAVLPPLKIRPDTMEYCLNDTVKFYYADSVSYQSNWWIIDGDTVSKKPSFTIKFDEKGSFEFELITRDFLGCYYTKKDTLYISQPEVNISSEVLTSCLPMDVIFKDSSISDTTLNRWRWTFGNGDTSYHAIDTVTYQNYGKKDVSLRVENIFGCADSIYINDYLSTSNFDINFTQSKVLICSGDSVVFRNQSSGNNIDYMWIFGEDTVIDNSTDVTFTFTQADTFDIILVGTNQLGCSIHEVKDDALIVGAQPQADFIATPLQSNCYPLDVNFTDLSTGNVTQWNWRFGDGNSSVFQNPFNEYSSLGTFDVFLKVVNDAGCEDSTLKTNYIQTNGPTADIQLNKDTACIHEAITFSLINQQNVNDFEWDFGDGSTSKNAVASHAFKRTGTVYFTLVLFDSLGLCRVTIRDSVHIFEISAEFTVDEDTACQPHRVLFTSTSPGASQLSWDFGDGNTANTPIINHTYQTPGLFTAELIVNSQLGCKDTTTQEILVHPKPQATIHNDTTICYGDTIQLWAKGGTEYHWDNEQFLSDDSSSTTIAWPDTTTTFTVEVFNEFNCIDTASILVSVQPPPLKNPLNYPDTSLIIGEYLDLDATAGEGFNYSWNPTDGLSCPNCPNPRAQPLKNTNYIVTISDPFGCFSYKDTIYIEVIEEYSLDVPNAFSPNGDGNNDIIYAKGWGLKELIAFKIYNRFGELVFESNEFDKGWDGTYKGKPQNIETYVYTVEAETYSGRVLSKKGNISLLR